MIYPETRMPVPIFIGIVFGVFFTLSCAHFDRSSSSETSQSDYEEQLERLNSELENDPGNLNLQLEKAEILFSISTIVENPDQRRPYYSNLRDLADTQYFRSGEVHPDLESITTKAWTTEQGEGLRLLQQDRAGSSETNHHLIVSHFKNAITINPDSLVTYNLLANTHYRNGEFNNAISTLEKANEIAGYQNPDIKEKLAYLYLESGNIEHSIEIYRELADEVPEDEHLKHGLANAYILNQQHEEAIGILRELSSRFTTRYEYNEALGTQLYFVLANKLDELSSGNEEDGMTTGEKEAVFELINEIDSIFETLKSELPFSEEQLVRSGAFYKNTASKLGSIQNTENEALLEELENKRLELLEKALPVWEKLFENHPDNTGYIKNLYLIYLELGKDEEAESLQRSFNL